MSMNHQSFRFWSFSKKWLLFLSFYLFILFPFATAWAKPVTSWQVQRVVANWLSLDAAPLGATISRQIREIAPYSDQSGNIMYFIVHLEPKGIVIVPGDDLVEPIGGFVIDAVSYDPSEDNPLGALVSRDLPGRVLGAREQESLVRDQGLEAMSDHFLKAQKKWAFLEGRVSEESMTESGLTTISDIRVAPLVQSKWSQGNVAGSYCYNYYTPNHYVCGCVATAMAQLMRYHSHPTTGVGTASFHIWVDGAYELRNLRGGDGSGGAYNWTNMMLVPDSTITATQRQAIGALTHDAGVSVNMSYEAGESGADTLEAATAFVSTFNYSNAKKGYNAGSNLPNLQRNNMVNPNLDASHPVLFGISRPGGGHAIVGDGYGYNASTLYHHLNMGWSGSNDAWYNLPTIDTSSRTYDSVYKVIYNVFPSGTGEIISGRVTDSSGNPLSGVTVTATRSGGGTYTATTNAKGIYALTKVPSASTYNINASKTGYSSSSLSVSTGTSTDRTTTTGNYWGANFSLTQEFGSSGKYRFVLKWGSEGSGDSQFRSPNGIAVDASGNVYVADSGNHRIQKFTSAGGYITQWGSYGSGNSQFQNPRGIAIDASGNVYVIDSWNNHRIQKFTSTGGYITKWGSYGSGNSQFLWPEAIAVDASGNVYVADFYNNRIQKFTSTGGYITKWGSYGSGNSQFLGPNGIAVDASGNVYVIEYHNGRIQKFTSGGGYITQWGSDGSGNSQFNLPSGIAVDASGNVYVADYYLYRIQKFTSNGGYITQWGSEGSGNSQFREPTGIAVDASGNVYVVDSGNNRIQKFAPKSASLPWLQLLLE